MGQPSRLHGDPRAERTPRDAGDDFFCLRFGVWYPSHDCALRTRFRTCASCRNCEQGRFNLRRHEADLRPGRRLLALIGELQDEARHAKRR